jgi:hypothetical protein
MYGPLARRADMTTEIHDLTDARPARGTGADAGPGRRFPGCRQPAPGHLRERAIVLADKAYDVDWLRRQMSQ